MASGLSDFITELKFSLQSTNTEWMEENLEKIYQNKARKEELAVELKERILKRKAQMEMELKSIALEHEGQLKRTEMKVKREISNYASFLDELDNMKSQIIAAFEGCSPIQALLIHRHACELLNKMWHEKEPEQRQKLEGRLIDLMTSVQNDQAASLKAPDTALKLLQRGESD